MSQYLYRATMLSDVEQTDIESYCVSYSLKKYRDKRKELVLTQLKLIVKIFIVFLFSLSYCSLSYFVKYFNIFTNIQLVKSILDAMNTRILSFAQDNEIFMIIVYTMINTLRDIIMQFKPCTAKFLFCCNIIYICLVLCLLLFYSVT